jgi:hypothetical protein
MKNERKKIEKRIFFVQMVMERWGDKGQRAKENR